MTGITSVGDSTSLVVSDTVADSLAVDSEDNHAPLVRVANQSVDDRMEEAEKKDKDKWNWLKVCTYVVLSHFALVTPSLSFPPTQRFRVGDQPSTIVELHILRTLPDILVDPIIVRRECRFISTQLVSHSCSRGAQ
jgi:hypothetical protein